MFPFFLFGLCCLPLFDILLSIKELMEASLRIVVTCHLSDFRRDFSSDVLILPTRLSVAEGRVLSAVKSIKFIRSAKRLVKS